MSPLREAVKALYRGSHTCSHRVRLRTPLVVHAQSPCGGSSSFDDDDYGFNDPAYATTAIMSSRLSPATTACIGALMTAARAPVRNATSCRRR